MGVQKSLDSFPNKGEHNLWPSWIIARQVSLWSKTTAVIKVSGKDAAESLWRACCQICCQPSALVRCGVWPADAFCSMQSLLLWVASTNTAVRLFVALHQCMVSTVITLRWKKPSWNCIIWYIKPYLYLVRKSFAFSEK